jgi:hypothetical protein
MRNLSILAMALIACLYGCSGSEPAPVEGDSPSSKGGVEAPNNPEKAGGRKATGAPGTGRGAADGGPDLLSESK